jgi:multiple sugar transport system permease protein
MWLYNDEFGLFNVILRAVGLPTPDWLGAEGWAMASLIIMGLWYVGGAMVIYLAALRDVPQALYDASAIDGVSPMRRFWHVTLPMISPAVLFNVVMGIIWSIQVFAVPYIMTKGGPDDATLFYTMYLYDNAFVFGRMGYASAMAWIQFLAIVVLTGGMFLLARKFVHYRAA